MTTYTALTTLSGRAPAESLGAALEALEPTPTGVGVFEIEDDSGLWEVGGYFTDPPDEIALALLAAAHGAKDFVVSEVPETDWVAHVRRELAPVSAGRFHVYGSHDADSVPEDRIALLIEASMAFGTGHHGTTLGCLRALDRLVESGVHPARVADIGCGTAVLAMAAARVWQDNEPLVHASDIDPVAVDVARQNVAANGLEGRVQCLEAAGFANASLKEVAPFNLIFANILKGPLIALAPDLCSALAPGGHAILSGILNDQAENVAEAYTRNGTNLEQSEQIGDWTTLTIRNKA